MTRRFTIQPRIDNTFEVIDADGRPVDTRPTQRSAGGYAYRLNQAAEASPDALVGMLCATRAA